MIHRAILFIDGNNWYHSLRRNAVAAPFELDYAKISRKLVGPRDWVQTRYYIGALPQSWDAQAYANQRRFLSRLTTTDTRITFRLGRLEPRREPNALAAQIREYIKTSSEALPTKASSDLLRLAAEHSNVLTLKEKAVDILLAVDMIRLANEDRYDAAYIVSADGDFSPAAEAVRATGRTVYAASLDVGYALRAAVNTYIHLKPAWLGDCYRVP